MNIPKNNNSNNSYLGTDRSYSISVAEHIGHSRGAAVLRGDVADNQWPRSSQM